MTFNDFLNYEKMKSRFQLLGRGVYIYIYIYIYTHTYGIYMQGVSGRIVNILGGGSMDYSG